MCNGSGWSFEKNLRSFETNKIMRILFTLLPFCCFAGLGDLVAQVPSGGAAALAVKPKEPLIPKAPARSEWTVRITTEFSGGWESSEEWETAQAMVSEQRSLRSIDYSKDAELQTYRLRSSWSDGESEDEWIVMGHHVAERAGGRGLYIVGSESAMTQELAKNDFPELAWVDMQSFRGVKTHKGKPVFIFNVPFDQMPLSGDDARFVEIARQADPKATPSKVLGAKVSEVVLYLDVQTQLPVLYNDGRSIRTYRFSQPSEARLRPPADVLAFLRGRAEALRARLTPPAGPGG